jgi:hypothetical protein
MTTKTTTVCDNCGTESADPKGEGWQKINLHPWEPGEIPEQGEASERWTVRDLCPRCAAKVRQWLQGELAAVFRLPRGTKAGATEGGADE